jgi:DNA invertase Pin-like site-specific DNA recombinase
MFDTSSQPRRTRVVGYVRVSTDQQADEGVSLDAQRAKLTSYAHTFDLELVEIFEDAGLSAKSLQRPGLQRALAILDSGNADGLLITKLDRLTRSVRDLGSLLEHYFEKRFALLSVFDSIDTRTAVGRLMLHLLSAVSQWERETTAERTRDALAQIRTEGVTLGGEEFGWRRSDRCDDHGRRIWEDAADESATIDRIGALRAEGCTIPQIIATLEAEGRATKRGGRWHPTTIKRILRRLRQ